MRPRATCLHCGADVESLAFCGVCGRSLRAGPPAEPRVLPGRMARLRRARRVRGGFLVMAVVCIAVLVALLADAPGIALLVAAFLLPLLIALRLIRLDVFEREPVRIWFLVGIAGFLAGVATAIGHAYVIDQFWFSDARFHAGAAGFAGKAAAGDGPPPIVVLVLSGIVLPILGVGLQFALPLLLRRFPPLRNEVVDGVILGAVAGCGFVAASTVVYFWPLVSGPVAGIGVSEVTAMILGAVFLRPVLFSLISGLIGAGIWRSALSQRSADLVVPVAIGLLALFLFTVVDLILMPYGVLAELGWLGLITVVLAVFGRRELHRAIRFDRERLMSGGGRVVCPRCCSVTPPGSFCAACGEPLSKPTPILHAESTQPEPVRAEAGTTHSILDSQGTDSQPE
jgi:RsiW-degrading membrane proteinase PrsW (M82 family)